MSKTEEHAKTGRSERSVRSVRSPKSGKTALGAFWGKKRSAGKIRPAGTGRRRVHRQAKDRLFRFLFEKDREALLQLYNTLNGTEYRERLYREFGLPEKGGKSYAGKNGDR